MEAAPGESLDEEEQNNISVYKKSIPSVVNATFAGRWHLISSMGSFPRRIQGSGFVIDKEAHSDICVIAHARQVEATMHRL